MCCTVRSLWYAIEEFSIIFIIVLIIIISVLCGRLSRGCIVTTLFGYDWA